MKKKNPIEEKNPIEMQNNPIEEKSIDIELKDNKDSDKNIKHKFDKFKNNKMVQKAIKLYEKHPKKCIIGVIIAAIALIVGGYNLFFTKTIRPLDEEETPKTKKQAKKTKRTKTG